MSFTAMLSMPRFLRHLISDPSLKGFFILGIIAPDRLFCDFSNHYYNRTPTKKGYHYGKVHTKVKREVELINQMLNNTDKVILHPKTSSFFRRIIDTPLKAIIFELGVVSHYVADAHQPFHTDGALRYPNIKFNEIPIHRAFEQDVRNNLNGLSKFYLESGISKKKPCKITDMEEFMLTINKTHNKYYDKLFNVYHPLNKQGEKTRFKKVLALTRVCFNDSIYNIRNVWCSLSNFEKKISEGVRAHKIMNTIKSKLDEKVRYKIKVLKNKNIKLVAQR